MVNLRFARCFPSTSRCSVAWAKRRRGSFASCTWLP